MNTLKQILLGFVVAWMLAGAFHSAAGAVYPLKVSSNGRYLVDQIDLPFLITGDSPQALIVNLTLAEVDAFLKNRATNGFNTVWINLLCETYTGGRPNGSLIDGTLPFTANLPSKSFYDLTKPNETYFARVDTIINLAAQYNLLVMLNPIESAGWGNTLDANYPAGCRSYGQYIGNRYKNFDNILWAHGNDHQGWQNFFTDLIIREVPIGVRENDNRHLNTVLLSYPVSSSMDSTNWIPLIELNSTYSYYPTYAQSLIDYNRSNFMPAFLAEANYEYEKDYTSSATLRRQEYWSLLSGSCGQMYGNYYTWQMIPGWDTHLNTPGTIQIGYLRKFFESRAWHDLIPDQDHSVVTAGYGTFSDIGSVNNSDYTTAARTSDGKLVLAYLPTIRTITVNMSKLLAPAFGHWFDPSSGFYFTITGSPLSNAGTRDFAPPGNNSDGQGDWVLVLETLPLATAPTISDIPNQSTTANTATAAIPFTVGDAETAPLSLTLSGSSSNPALVPNGNIVFGGSGANRTVTATPAAGQLGTATITVTVTDGTLTADAGFVLSVLPDADMDMIPDAWEILHGLNANDSSDAGLDSDGDGMTNLQEYLAGTDPNDPGSSMQIINVESIGNDVRLSFSSVSGKRYRVEGTADIPTNLWTTVADNVLGTGSIVQVVDSNRASQNRYFYSVRLLP